MPAQVPAHPPERFTGDEPAVVLPLRRGGGESEPGAGDRGRRWRGRGPGQGSGLVERVLFGGAGDSDEDVSPQLDRDGRVSVGGVTRDLLRLVNALLCPLVHGEPVPAQVSGDVAVVERPVVGVLRDHRAGDRVVAGDELGPLLPRQNPRQPRRRSSRVAGLGRFKPQDAHPPVGDSGVDLAADPHREVVLTVRRPHVDLRSGPSVGAVQVTGLGQVMPERPGPGVEPVQAGR